MITVQALVLLGPGRLALPGRIATAALAFPVVGAAVALLFGLAFGYWSS